MTGKRITKQQIGVYMTEKKKGCTNKVAAGRSGFSERSAYHVQDRKHKPAQTQRSWKTRKDPFENVWDSEVIPMLEKTPRLQAKTILGELQRRYPDDFPDSILRTLYRRVRDWQAKYGPEKEIIFRQEHPIGWQALSDFTDGSKLKVTIRGEPLDHLLYHYWLAYSKWEYTGVILGGESFTALAENFQNALWSCGGVSETHRTDSLSAAYKNLPNKEQEDFTNRYKELCAHYNIEPTRNNKGVSHENGSVEASHGGLKNDAEQALLLRGSRDFESIDAYKEFVYGISVRRNRRNHKRYLEELAVLRPLPQHRTTDFEERRAKVSCGSTITICDRLYSVPSRLIGMSVKVHLYDDRLECFLGTTFIKTMSRLRGNQWSHIDYREMIHSLSCKPQAFRNYIYHDEMFPYPVFREAWNMLEKNLDKKSSCKEYVKILRTAAKNSIQEERVCAYLLKKMQEQSLPSSKEVIGLFQKTNTLPKNNIRPSDLSSYNSLLAGGVQ